MPRGPNGEKRPADVNAAAVMVARIATGEAEENCPKVPGRRKSGVAGAAARTRTLSAEERKAIATKAAQRRWG